MTCKHCAHQQSKIDLMREALLSALLVLQRVDHLHAATVLRHVRTALAAVEVQTTKIEKEGASNDK